MTLTNSGRVGRDSSANTVRHFQLITTDQPCLCLLLNHRNHAQHRAFTRQELPSWANTYRPSANLSTLSSAFSTPTFLRRIQVSQQQQGAHYRINPLTQPLALTHLVPYGTDGQLAFMAPYPRERTANASALTESEQRPQMSFGTQHHDCFPNSHKVRR